jgi:hypothetical protein
MPRPKELLRLLHLRSAYEYGRFLWSFWELLKKEKEDSKLFFPIVIDNEGKTNNANLKLLIKETIRRSFKTGLVVIVAFANFHNNRKPQSMTHSLYMFFYCCGHSLS